jgi:hypothetical protein
MAGQTLSNGQIIPPEPAMKTHPAQIVPGGILNAAADKTIASTNHQVETAEKMGAGQKGGRKRRVKRGGATTLNAPSSLLPTAGSIPGVDPTDISIRNVNTLNAIRFAATGDKLVNAAPYYPAKTGGKRTKRKAKHGRRNSRTHRRGHRKSSHGSRRSRRNV